MLKLRAFREFYLVFLIGAACTVQPPAASEPDVWTLGRAMGGVHRFSTLFTAQDVRNHLSSDEGLDKAINWCKATAVTRVYVEVFRDGYQAERAALVKARDRFRSEGFLVSGCVTPTQVGKKSNGWTSIACYTDLPTQQHIQEIFEFGASLFDEIMIDDFWFTDCTCPDCKAALASRTVTVGEKKTPIASDSWEEYRRELMLRISEERLIAPAKRVNPKCALIIKYPQWYDDFHLRGYDVLAETALFPKIWVGTETRDYNDKRWGGTVQYEAYFIMRWLGGIGGVKCGGGWYDWLGTTEKTYLEQARQTILAGAKESMLFCYGGLQGTTGPKNIETLRAHLPELFSLAEKVAARQPVGLAAYKPGNSAPGNEKRVFDFVGMLGLPLAPCHEFPTNAPAAFFSLHSLKDPAFAEKFAAFVGRGRPALITDGLAAKLGESPSLRGKNVHILKVKGDPKSLLQMGREDLDALRAPCLEPFKASLSAPNQVALYLFSDGSSVIENFNDEPAEVKFGGKVLSVPPRGWTQDWRKAR